MSSAYRFTVLLLAASCQGASSSAPAEVEVCTQLVESDPASWPTLLPEVLDHGPSAAVHLMSALERDPDAPGAQAALAALGALGNPDAGPYLEAWLQQRRPQSADAALSLGRLPYSESVALLRSVAGDPRGDPTLRTACAAALVELGHGRDVIDLLRAVLLQGTPEGEELGDTLGLPHRNRWALERHMIILAVRHRLGEDMDLDTDSPWPRLRSSVEALTRALEGER